ncbi:unnamed protein product [Trichobilharzia regenti]|nr:unnamed protein product [Trichobilharzia regenti]
MGIRMVKILDVEDHSVHNRQLRRIKISEVDRSDYNFSDYASNSDFVDDSEISPDDTDENYVTKPVRSLQANRDLIVNTRGAT